MTLNILDIPQAGRLAIDKFYVEAIKQNFTTCLFSGRLLLRNILTPVHAKVSRLETGDLYP
ncbi:MAG: hypothetical protein CME01_08230 [Geminicoccus sp.]|nr:hypothetical protein [Geminicoccus sp.]